VTKIYQKKLESLPINLENQLRFLNNQISP